MTVSSLINVDIVIQFCPHVTVSSLINVDIVIQFWTTCDTLFTH